ncbi:MAG: serine/threonine-protein phosphatase, partial [Anaerolineae bacterium]|nr:serine/threonine-protein phosphatase [Anaerolineae bacterium]
GLPAALAAVSLHTAIRTGLRLGLSPAEVLDLVNDEFYDAYTRTDLLATAAVLSVDPQTGAFEQANAGHPPTLIGQQGQWTLLKATAPPIGVLPDLGVESQEFQLKPGDLVTGYSDGYSEIETAAGFWGEQGLMQALGQTRADADLAAEQIQRAAEIARAGHDLHDDQTLVIMSFRA